MTSHGELLTQQSKASLEMLEVCREYGELQRTAPRSPEAEALRLQIEQYYRDHTTG